MDIVNLLKKIRLTNNVVHNILTKDQKKLLRYQKSSVVDDRSDSNSFSGSFSDDNQSD